jgi:hypothetical protein
MEPVAVAGDVYGAKAAGGQVVERLLIGSGV